MRCNLFCSTTTEAYQYYYWTYNWMEMYFYQVTLYYVPINLTLNIWNIVIFRQRPFRNISFGFYLTCLSITDILASIGLVLSFIESFGFVLNIPAYSALACRFSFYVGNTFEYFSPWILTLIAIDRLISMRSHNLSMLLAMTRFRVCILGVLLVLLLLPNISWIVDYQTNMGNATTFCVMNDDNAARVVSISDMLSIVLKASLPFLIMTTANVFTSITLIKLKMKLKVKKLHRELRFILTTILLNVLFLICMMPYAVLSFMFTFIVTKAELNEYDLRLLPIFFPLLSITKGLKYLYPLVQTILYIAFNRKYRKACGYTLKTLFCLKTYRNWKKKRNL